MKDYAWVVVDVDSNTPLADRVAYAAAQQAQLRDDYAPAWDGAGENDTVRAATPDALPKPGEIQIQLHKDAPSDQAGALAYHTSQPDGTPICHVFVELAKQCGDSWTSCASHEVLETRGDPRLRLCVEMDDGSIWDHENCDRVQAQSYTKLGVELSSFNYPTAFEPPADKTGVKYDFLGKSTAPNQTLPGGYSQKFDPAHGWTMIQNGRMAPYRAHLLAMGLSRGARRVARSFVKAPWWRRALRALAFWR